jgi:ribosomal protein L11 methyltransferase
LLWPALDIRNADPDLVLAAVDDFAPTAVEELADGVTVYFPTTARRDGARAALSTAFPRSIVSSRDVDDGDWARRSQQNLTAIAVGRVTVSPPWLVTDPLGASNLPAGADLPAGAFTVVIEPSMGFGTGHHATTRLCLAALQMLDLKGRTVLDVGTGSGVLAITAARLGAREVIALDVDSDAVQNARDNLRLNPAASRVHLETADLRDASLTPADVVIGNLTGGVLVQNADRLRSLVRRGGMLVVSGLLADERSAVSRAFTPATVRWSSEEAGWVALMFECRA